MFLEKFLAIFPKTLSNVFLNKSIHIVIFVLFLQKEELVAPEVAAPTPVVEAAVEVPAKKVRLH